MLSSFFSRNHSIFTSFFDLNQMRTREEASPEAPQALLCGKPPGLKLLTTSSCSPFLLKQGAGQVLLSSLARHGEPVRAPGRYLRQHSPTTHYISSCKNFCMFPSCPLFPCFYKNQNIKEKVLNCSDKEQQETKVHQILLYLTSTPLTHV